jgi:uncharacterized protein YbjT (DUF2867 family)
MKTALVAGATGLVGGELIKLLIENPGYGKVVVLSRRQLAISHPKLEVVITSFEHLEATPLPCPIDVCFCTLGTTQKKSGKQGLYQVDVEYVVKLARLSAQQAGKFLVVSSQGASANSSFFYMKSKGEMEEQVKTSGNGTIYILRPSLITGKREEFRFAEKAGSLLYALFTPLMVGKLRKVRPVSATKIAKCMIGLAENNEKGVFTIESDVIQGY